MPTPKLAARATISDLSSPWSCSAGADSVDGAAGDVAVAVRLGTVVAARPVSAAEVKGDTPAPSDPPAAVVVAGASVAVSAAMAVAQ
jgi:hypothetical protein